MKTIEIDFDVWKELTTRLENEQDSYSDVLRRDYGLANTHEGVGNGLDSGRPWIKKGVTFQEGTEFRALYKNNYYYGKVEDGALSIDGKSFTSPSRAARHVTGNSVNGWIFWECKLPGKNSFQIIDSLRR